MFEDFSFSSPSSTRLDADDDRVMLDCDSGLISPLSSRCPSPKSFYHRPQRSLPRPRSSLFRPSHQQPPTSVPFPYAYDHYNKRLSITTLTKKLHEHTLNNPEFALVTDDRQPLSPTSPQSMSDMVPGSARFPGYFLTPPDTDQDDNEGLYDSSSMTSSPQSTPQSPFLRPTSVPAECMSLSSSDNRGREISPISISNQDKQSIRTKRQHMSRLQCNSTTGVDAVRRALEEEALEMDPFVGEDDCHPSSLPPQLSPPRRRAKRTRPRPMAASGGLYELSVPESHARRKSSSCGPSSHRIDKSYGRDLRKRSEQGLRRKSLVSAALASMAEKASNSNV